MDFQQLMTFCTVISEGSMTAAANKMSVTQPAVSQQIRNLEEELDTKLLVRGVRQIRLTIQGQLLYNYAKKILNLTQKVETTIKTMLNSELEGHIQIATLNSIGLNFITPTIGTILNPNQKKLKVGLFYGTGVEVIEKMKTKEVDIAILPDMKEQYGLSLPGYESQFLFKDDLLFVGSGKDSSLPKTISIRNLELRPMVAFKHLYPKFRYHLYKIATQNKVDIQAPIFESNNVGTLKRIIEVWMCWGWLPYHSIHKQIRMGRLSVIQLEEMNYSMNIKAYYKSNQSEKKQRIIDTVLMVIQKQHHLY
ncbi:MAG: LysR family transcriptional regulator [Bdellovibrionales bacterium]|nr:LysR family transcriptional regulator [Bdellovibrionales bacterium]